jgi:cyclopropane fatty-acyl-phospholipid synthase-like methyltransferase
MEKSETKYFSLIKNKLESSAETALLDAGCGWGR